MKVTSSSGNNIHQVVSYLMLTILYFLVNTKPLILVMNRTYEFTTGITIPHLMYRTYEQMDVCIH